MAEAFSSCRGESGSASSSVLFLQPAGASSGHAVLCCMLCHMEACGVVQLIDVGAPLPAFPCRFASPTIFLDNVTLVLPQPDFAALLSAALRGPEWLQGAHTTRPLMQGISMWEVGSPAFYGAPSRELLALAHYSGWGVEATSLCLVPETPLPADFPLPDPPQTQPADSQVSEERGSTNAVGIGVGVGVGSALLLAAVAGVWWWHTRGSAASSGAASKYAMEKEGGEAGVSLQKGSATAPAPPVAQLACNEAGGRPGALQQTLTSTWVSWDVSNSGTVSGMAGLVHPTSQQAGLGSPLGSLIHDYSLARKEGQQGRGGQPNQRQPGGPAGSHHMMPSCNTNDFREEVERVAAGFGSGDGDKVGVFQVWS